MNLHAQLCARQDAGNPIRVGLIGAGKFGAMFLAQATRSSANVANASSKKVTEQVFPTLQMFRSIE